MSDRRPADRRLYNLQEFSLRSMTQCSAALRALGVGASSLEEVAGRVVRYFYEHMGFSPSPEPACALVRFFKTHPFGALDEGSRRYVVGLLGRQPDIPSTKCLTLMASAGLRPEWNDRTQSKHYKAVPITGDRFSMQFPMFSQLLTQCGVSVDALLPSGHELLVDEHEKSYNVFFVPRAAGSPYVPVQQEFVLRYGIQSVVGFGGLLPSGNLFTVILFTRAEIPRETVELFRTLALAVKVAVLPFDGNRVFAPDARTDTQESTP